MSKLTVTPSTTNNTNAQTPKSKAPFFQNHDEGAVNMAERSVKRTPVMAVPYGKMSKTITTRFKTVPEQACDIVQSMMNAYDTAWCTYEDELVTMYLTDDVHIILSLRTALLTIYEWCD